MTLKSFVLQQFIVSTQASFSICKIFSLTAIINDVIKDPANVFEEELLHQSQQQTSHLRIYEFLEEGTHTFSDHRGLKLILNEG